MEPFPLGSTVRTNEHAEQDTCRSRGWYRARDERLRPANRGGRRGSPYVAIDSEPLPKLIVDPTPLTAGSPMASSRSSLGGERAYRSRGARAATLNVSPRSASARTHRRCTLGLGREANDVNTISVAGLPPGWPASDAGRVGRRPTPRFAGCTGCQTDGDGGSRRAVSLQLKVMTRASRSSVAVESDAS